MLGSPVWTLGNHSTTGSAWCTDNNFAPIAGCFGSDALCRCLAVQETVNPIDLPKNRALLGFSNCLRWSLLLGYQKAASRVERPRFIFEDVAMQNTSQETDNLRAELDRATHAIKGLRENLALLTTKLESVIDKAIAQAEKSSDSSAKLARSLNIITGCLVGVGIFVSLVCLHR